MKLNIKSDLDKIVRTIKWRRYRYAIDESDKSVIFSFKTATEANNVYKDLNSLRSFKDLWRLDIQGNKLFYRVE